VQEVGRAVERIDDPQVVGGGIRASTIAASAARSTSLTKSLGPFAVTVSMSRSRAPRLMTLPARRAALTAVVSIGCMIAGASLGVPRFTSVARRRFVPALVAACANLSILPAFA
jgi:hypothetical protein